MQKFDLDFTWFPHKYDSREANFHFIIEQKLEKTIYSKRGKEYAIYICTLSDGAGSNQTGFCPCPHFSSTLMASTRSLIWQPPMEPHSDSTVRNCFWHCLSHRS